jgi:hypothetical protein
MEERYLFAYGSKDTCGRWRRDLVVPKNIMTYILEHPDIACRVILADSGHSGIGSATVAELMEFELLLRIERAKKMKMPFTDPTIVVLHYGRCNSILLETKALAQYLAEHQVTECRIMFPLYRWYAVWKSLNYFIPHATFYLLNIPQWIPKLPSWLTRQYKQQEKLLA